MRVVVVGGSIAGISTAVALSGDGHDVVLIEPDDLEPADDWRSAFDVGRSVPQFQLPHFFLALGCGVLRARMPDVYGDLVGAGAMPVDIGSDPQLGTLAVRRALIEWGLQRALRRSSNIDVRTGVRARDLETHDGVVTGIALEGETINADVVVDAAGRRSPLVNGRSSRSQDCGALTYARYYELEPGVPIPDMVTPVAVRGDTGYMGYSVMWEDNATFGVIFNVPWWDRDLRILREDTAHHAVARSIDALASLVDPSFARPVSDVLAMGRIANEYRSFLVDGEPHVLGYIPVGDSRCHTDPAFAFGMSLALKHAFDLADILRNASDLTDVAMRYHEATESETSAWYDVSAQTDEARIARWKGKRLDASSPDGCLPLFLAGPLRVAALADPEIFGKFMRRAHMLDAPSVIEDDHDLLWRGAAIFKERMAADPPAPPPAREDLLSRGREASTA